MTNQELRALDAEIAELLGWTLYSDTARFIPSDTMHRFRSECPHYSTNIAEAMELAETLRKNWTVLLQLSGGRNQYVVRLWPFVAAPFSAKELIYHTVYHVGEIISGGESLPLAIALAARDALKAGKP